METIQTRKLHVIEYLASMQDEPLLSEIETILKEARTKRISTELTKEDLENRALKSMEDIRLGKVCSQQELEINAQLW
jgi:hypothetical protein